MYPRLFPNENHKKWIQKKGKTWSCWTFTSCWIARSTQPKILASCELTQRITNVPDIDSIWKIYEVTIKRMIRNKRNNTSVLIIFLISLHYQNQIYFTIAHICWLTVSEDKFTFKKHMCKVKIKPNYWPGKELFS